MAERLGLEGKELNIFIEKNQAEEREERARRREEEKEQREYDERKINEQREYDERKINEQRENDERKINEQRENDERKLSEQREFELKKLESDERKVNEERESEERQRQFELKKLREQGEFELKKIELECERDNHSGGNGMRAKVPRLPSFNERDNMDAYLERFERFAKMQKWPEDEWAIYLSALLTGRATEVYARMPFEESQKYDQLKEALLRKFDLTKNGFRDKFKFEKPEDSETPAQFVVRIGGYLDRWIELAKIEKKYKNLHDMFVREQFLDSCDRDLNTYLNEHDKESLDTLTELALAYVTAHNRTFRSASKYKSNANNHVNNNRQVKCERCHKLGHTGNKCKTVCYKCRETGHISVDCKAAIARQLDTNKDKFNRRENGDNRTCFICSKRGHIAPDCKNRTVVASACTTQIETSDSSGGERGRIRYLMDEPCKCIVQTGLMTASGQKVDIVSASCTSANISTNLPVTEGYVAEHKVQVLRDSGCSGAIVKRGLVSDEQLNGNEQSCMLADGSIVKMPLAEIEVDTPYLVGKIEAMCMTQPVFNLILGNIPGVRKPEDPDPEWQCKIRAMETSAVMTRAQVEKERRVTQPLKVTEAPSVVEDVDPKRLIELQQTDITLAKVFKTVGKQQTRNNIYWYETQNGITYRIHKTLGQRQDRVVKQLVVPKVLRNTIMSVAHEAILAGHMGANKTLNRIKSAFYWPCMDGDVRRYCKSCDICQRTIAKGKVTKVPVGEMPMIDVAFKRVGLDLVGPIYPASERVSK